MAFTSPAYWPQAQRELSARDAVLRELISRFGGFCLNRRSSAFVTLSRAIIGQQISVKAAHSVWLKLATTVETVRPEHLCALSDEALRGCGLSRQKMLYLRDLAQRFMDGSLNVRRWQRRGDEEIIAELTTVKGIGRWTAEMFLIFYLLRPNVLPLTDIGLQRAVSKYYNNDAPASADEIRAVAENWSPWRSVATWYLWRSFDPVPVEY
ncbi:MAG: DNA-3-methyladenine glycosylase family protein [Burkholderiales bacterium]